jgi:hypothetical protein
VRLAVDGRLERSAGLFHRSGIIRADAGFQLLLDRLQLRGELCPTQLLVGGRRPECRGDQKERR